MKYTIETALALGDDEIDEMLGLRCQRDEFKKTLEEADKLEGGARNDFEGELNRTLNPTVYVGGLKYDLERAKRDKCADVSEVCGCSPRYCG